MTDEGQPLRCFLRFFASKVLVLPSSAPVCELGHLPPGEGFCLFGYEKQDLSFLYRLHPQAGRFANTDSGESPCYPEQNGGASPTRISAKPSDHAATVNTEIPHRKRVISSEVERSWHRSHHSISCSAKIPRFRFATLGMTPPWGRYSYLP